MPSKFCQKGSCMATYEKDFYDILVSCLSMNFKIGQLKSATPNGWKLY